MWDGLLVRGLVAWLVLVVLAAANGALREFALVPRLGDAPAHVASTILLVVLILVVAKVVVAGGGQSTAALLLLGATWTVLTVAFEFGLGRATGKSWDALLADYDLAAGRVWPLVLVATAVGPWLMARLAR